MVLATGLCLNAQLVGNPSVNYTVDEVGTDFITITFTPNADAAGYAICLFEAGTAEQQFAMFGPWMGFQTPKPRATSTPGQIRIRERTMKFTCNAGTSTMLMPK